MKVAAPPTPSVYDYPLRTCPFREDALRAFQRDYHGPAVPLPLRTCPFDHPPLVDYRARVTQAFEQSPPQLATRATLSVWA